jgi:hypothetical protein
LSKKTAQCFTTNPTVKHALHEKLDGETQIAVVSSTMISLDDFSLGFLIGLLVGEGHFGGDGRQPQVTLRMHVKHEKLFRWLERTIPQGKLYGPYNHGGRAYFQWMIRGEPLRGMLVPLIAERLDWLDDHVAARFLTMCERYGIPIDRA